MSPTTVDQVLATLTPQALRETILALAARQAPGNRNGVTLAPIVEALTGSAAIGAGEQGWRDYLRLREAIRATVEQIAGMKYVESDA